MKILIVDDTKPARKPTEILLRAKGHQVFTADDGAEALTTCRNMDLDLVITDIRMPRMDGLTLLKHIKEEKPGLDVIIVTGYGDVNSSVEALRYGAANYIMKPVNLEEMAMAVAKTEERQALTRKLKEQEERLAQARKMAELGLIAAGVAHEINNPNTFIRGNVQTLKKFWEVLEPFYHQAVQSGITPPSKMDFITREMPKILEALLHGTDRIKKIVDSMASFTRLEANTQVTADLNDCVNETLSKETPDLSAIHVETCLAGHLPAVRASREGLEEIISELMRNSCKAVTNCPDPKVIIKTKHVSPEEIMLIVEDNGVGIKTDDQQKIFTPFFSTDPRIGQPGLGLTKLYALVRCFGGEVSFNSQENRGTVFQITLPAAPALGA